MTLKEKVIEHIKKHGPQTNADLVKKFKVKAASLRRTCGELAKEGKLAPLPSKVGRLWGIASDERELPKPATKSTNGTKPATTRTSKAKSSMPAPTPATKRKESASSSDPDDWRGFSF